MNFEVVEALDAEWGILFQRGPFTSFHSHLFIFVRDHPPSPLLPLLTLGYWAGQPSFVKAEPKG